MEGLGNIFGMMMGIVVVIFLTLIVISAKIKPRELVDRF